MKGIGFSAEIQGVERFFAFVCLPFGFYDSARVLTKVLKHVIEKWRKESTVCFIHIDDGIVTASTVEVTEHVARKVKNDLGKFGFILSPEKCVWTPTQKLVWTGIEWDTAEFSCKIPEEKLRKAERRIQSLLSRVDSKVPVKDLASVVGLLNSFRYCVGEEMSRFYTRRASIHFTQKKISCTSIFLQPLANSL